MLQENHFIVELGRNMLGKKVYLRTLTNFKNISRSAVSWEKITPEEGNAPTGRCGSAGFYGNNAIFMFAGDVASPPTGVSADDFWKFDLNTKQWEEITTTHKPSKRYCHSMTLLNENQFILHGGATDPKTKLGDTWEYNLDKNEWNELTKEGPQVDIHTVVQGKDNKLISFGGRFLDKEYTDYAPVYSFD